MFTVFKTEQEVLEKLQDLIETIANESINNRGKFFIGFSGGSLGKYLCEILPNIKTDWTKWTIFFCDERVVKSDSADSTFGFYKANLIPKLPSLNEGQFMWICVEDPIEKIANDYEKTIREKFEMKEGIPSFDLLLLGIGDDGHTCSLFPNHKLLEENNFLVAPISDSPKPPPQRITMTYPLINNARHAIFTIPGVSKAEIIRKIFTENADLPARRVKALEKVHWLLDEHSASKL